MTVFSPMRTVVERTVSSCSRNSVGGCVARTAAAFTGSIHQQHPQSHEQQQQQQQRRSFWMDVVTRKPEKGRYAKQRMQQQQQANNNNNDDTKKVASDGLVHEDPEQVVRRHTDETRSDGESLLDLMFFNDRHEKAWKRRQRLKATKRYEFDKKHVNDLAKYIAFVKDHEEGTK